MTEREWLTVVAPESMLEWVAPRCTERQLRLFAVACCRRVAHLCREKFAATLVQAEAFAEPPPAAPPRLAAMWMTRDESALAHALSSPQAIESARRAGEHTTAMARAAGDSWGEARWFHAAYLGDIAGNPFRTVAFAPGWRTETAVAIALQMYESRDFAAMPILADALQDAGCDTDDLLTHCRDPHGVHVRGCWVVDLVLGKS